MQKRNRIGECLHLMCPAAALAGDELHLYFVVFFGGDDPLGKKVVIEVLEPHFFRRRFAHLLLKTGLFVHMISSPAGFRITSMPKYWEENFRDCRIF